MKMETIGRNARSIISISVVYLSFAFLFTLLIKTVPVGNETILNVAAGIVLGVLSSVCAYYFGSSKDKSDKEKAEIAVAEKTATVATKTDTIAAHPIKDVKDE